MFSEMFWSRKDRVAVNLGHFPIRSCGKRPGTIFSINLAKIMINILNGRIKTWYALSMTLLMAEIT